MYLLMNVEVQRTLIPIEVDNKIMTSCLVVGMMDWELSCAVMTGQTLVYQQDLGTNCPRVK